MVNLIQHIILSIKIKKLYLGKNHLVKINLYIFKQKIINF